MKTLHTMNQADLALASLVGAVGDALAAMGPVGGLVPLVACAMVAGWFGKVGL